MFFYQTFQQSAGKHRFFYLLWVTLSGRGAIFTEDEIAAHIHYPQITYNANKEGDVYVAFLVDRNGEVTNTEILSSFDVYASASVTETLSKEIFYPKKVNKVPSVTLLYSKVSFELENAMVSVQFADTSFLPISTSQEEELLSRFIEQHIYFTDPVLIGGLESLVVNYPEEALQEEVEGVVIVQFLVGERGDVIKPRVVQGLVLAVMKRQLKPFVVYRLNPAPKTASLCL